MWRSSVEEKLLVWPSDRSGKPRVLLSSAFSSPKVINFRRINETVKDLFINRFIKTQVRPTTKHILFDRWHPRCPTKTSDAWRGRCKQRFVPKARQPSFRQLCHGSCQCYEDTCWRRKGGESKFYLHSPNSSIPMVAFGGSLDALQVIAGEQRLTTRGKLLGWTSQRRLFFKVIECVSIYLLCNFIDFVCLLCNCLVVTDKMGGGTF